MKITNNGQRLEGIVAGGRTVYLKPSETRDLDLSADEAKRAKRLSSVAVAGSAPEPDDDPELAEKEAIVAELEALGVKKTTRTSLDNLRAALEEAKKE